MGSIHLHKLKILTKLFSKTDKTNSKVKHYKYSRHRKKLEYSNRKNLMYAKQKGKTINVT